MSNAPNQRRLVRGVPGKRQLVRVGGPDLHVVSDPEPEPTDRARLDALLAAATRPTWLGTTYLAARLLADDHSPNRLPRDEVLEALLDRGEQIGLSEHILRITPAWLDAGHVRYRFYDGAHINHVSIGSWNESVLHSKGIASEVAIPYVVSGWTRWLLDSKATMKRLGFPSGTEPGGLLLQWFDAYGLVPDCYQYRPPDSVVVDGRKYLLTNSQPQMLFVPIESVLTIDDPATPLVFTESPLKALSMLSNGLEGCIIGLNGIWGWSGRNDKGGRGTPLIDFRDIVLRDRRVIVCFDSDIHTNPKVRRCLVEFLRWLERRGAEVEWLDLAPDEDGGKVGIDDFFVSGHTAGDMWQLVRPGIPALVTENVAVSSLPEEFWESRPVLAHIRQAAHSRGRSSAAVLNNVFARAGAMLPHTLKLPAIVGSEAILSYYAANVSPPGTGRSTAIAIAVELLPWPHGIKDLLPIGSGEGLCDALFETVTETNSKGKEVPVRKQVHHNAMFSVDEGQMLEALKVRGGSTVVANLCSIFTGGTLGSTNTEKGGNRRYVPAGSYNYGLMLTIQDKMSETLIKLVNTGLTQRFNWADAMDVTIPPPGERPAWPGPLKCDPPSDEQLAPLTKPIWGEGDDGLPLPIPNPTYLIPVAQSVRDEIANADWLRSTGHDDDDEAAHWYLKREKTALLLAWVTEGRLDINEEDWGLAGMVSEASDHTYERVKSVLSAEAAQKEKTESAKQARRHVQAVASEEGWRIVACAKKIWAKVKDEPGISRKALSSGLRYWREVLDEGLDHALGEGWILEKNEASHTGSDKRSFYPGEKHP
jgi:hypothetical protein